MDTRTTRTLPVRLTEDEVAVRSQELAEVELERLERTQALEGAVEEWKEQRKAIENAAAASVTESVRLARIVKYREEPREVACAVVVENGQYIVTRMDTGEVVAQRAATAAELQVNLFDTAGDAVDDAVKGAIDAAAKAEPSNEEADGPTPQSELWGRK